MTELLRKSGIIDKHIKEFEKWRLIDPFEKPAEAKSADEMVGDLVQEIAELLEKEPTMRQTLVAPVYTKQPPKLWINEEISFYAITDEMGKLVADPRTKIFRGDIIWHTGDGPEFRVLEVEQLHENDKLVAKLITIEED